MLRLFSGGDGTSLTAAEPHNNIMRITSRRYAIILSGAQAVHTISWDEAMRLPRKNRRYLPCERSKSLPTKVGLRERQSLWRLSPLSRL